VALADRRDDLARGGDASALGLVRGGEELVGHAAHRGGDGHDGGLLRGVREEGRGPEDALGVAQRGASELVDDDGKGFLHAGADANATAPTRPGAVSSRSVPAAETKGGTT
jgi:hypothetical protein